MEDELYKDGYTQNRELSWLSFNERVLAQARKKENPLLERMKFISIFSSNLDEFFRVRVGGLSYQNEVSPKDIDSKSGMTSAQQLKEIYARVRKDYKKRQKVYGEVTAQLKKHNIEEVAPRDCTKSEQRYLSEKFRREISPLLGAQVVDSRHPMPVLQSGRIYAAGILEYQGQTVFAFAPIPEHLPQIFVLPNTKNNIRYVLLERLVEQNMASLFVGAKVLSTVRFVITRSAELTEADLETFEEITDYRDKMEAMMKERKRLDAVRIEFHKKPDVRLENYLLEKAKVTKEQVLIADMPLNRKLGYQLDDAIPTDMKEGLVYESYRPKLSADLTYQESIFSQIQKKDVLLHYPYQSMDPFLLLMKQCCSDPEVTSIRITIYRLARKAKLVDYLCRAAENGKEVIVLIELKARFDELNNIDYSERLEDAGCTVLYGFEDYKVHSKICLISRNHENKTEHCVLISTGNFNENTAKQYEDFALMTSRSSIVKDSIAFFRNMMTGRLDGTYRYLLVSPVTMKETLLKLIEAEAAKGENGRITLKMNSVTDADLIAALSKASRAGCEIRMIVRGICCILPDIENKTENIQIISIVGRYLEHSRIYAFGSGRSEKMYISSADFMTRNTEHRVEIACPIYDAAIRRRINEFLTLCFEDDIRAKELRKDGTYRNRKLHTEIDSQAELMAHMPESNEEIPVSVSREKRSAQPFKTVYKKKKN